MQKPEIIKIENVSKEYKLGKQKIRILNDVSLSIKKGEFVTLVGASGSGKSSLLNVIGGLDTPTSGEIVVDGVSLKSLSDRKMSIFRNKTIGFIFQSFYLQPFLSILGNIEIAGMPSRTNRKIRLKKARKMAEAVGLGDRLNHRPNQLSGGQIQRVAIARALLNNPKIIIADEPTGNLDSKNGSEIVSLFRSLQKEFNTTVIMATHDREIARQSDRVIEILDGEIKND